MLELLVVVGIITVLASMVLPAVARTRTIGSGMVCLNNLKQWGLATQLYAGDNEDFLPPEGFANPGAGHTNSGWYIQLPRVLDLDLPLQSAPQQRQQPLPLLLELAGGWIWLKRQAREAFEHCPSIECRVAV
jgi:hypothetical protein